MRIDRRRWKPGWFDYFLVRLNQYRKMKAKSGHLRALQDIYLESGQKSKIIWNPLWNRRPRE